MPASAKAAGTTLSAMEGKPMDNTNEQEATDGAQAHRPKLNVASSEYGVPADLIHGDTEDEIKEIPTT